VLDDDALALVEELERRFRGPLGALLVARAQQQRRVDRGEDLRYPRDASIRAGTWQVPPAPRDLRDRRVEITGPAEPKLMINALGSGASCFMADLEDALSPTWANVLRGHAALHDAARGMLMFDAPDGRAYRQPAHGATLLARPRGWHLSERHVEVDGRPVSASLFDAALYLAHNAHVLCARGSGPYLYLPKLQAASEAALWYDVLCAAEDHLGLPRGTVRATVLIETLPAAFEMPEILHALGEHATGLNAGRWDYIFSAIKTLRTRRSALLPNRAAVTMTAPFMRAYTEQLVRACHAHGAHAMGGMSAFVPSRQDEAINANALAQVRADKQREAADGFDGTWVAHPDLVPVAREAFDDVLGDRPNQIARRRDDVPSDPRALLALARTQGAVSEQGVRTNVSVALRYLAAWLGGTGAVALDGLMEDAATAEIARMQLWQWVRHRATLNDGRTLSAQLYLELQRAELQRLPITAQTLRAASLLHDLVLAVRPPEFLTLGASRLLD
jgi:malate synthase